MPDIEITCSKCGNVVTVSEFADADGMVCHLCGEPLHKPQLMSLEPRPLTRRLKINWNQPLNTPADETSAPVETNPAPAGAVREEGARPRKIRMSRPVGSWLLFLLLGGFMYYWRYQVGLSDSQIEQVRFFGPIIVLAFQVLISVRAFADSVFQGILCLIVPFYSLYYLLMVCDSYLLRAVVVAVLIGIGQDSAQVIGEQSKKTYAAVMGWIRSGGDSEVDKIVKQPKKPGSKTPVKPK